MATVVEMAPYSRTSCALDAPIPSAHLSCSARWTSKMLGCLVDFGRQTVHQILLLAFSTAGDRIYRIKYFDTI